MASILPAACVMHKTVCRVFLVCPLKLVMMLLLGSWDVHPLFKDLRCSLQSADLIKLLA